LHVTIRYRNERDRRIREWCAALEFLEQRLIAHNRSAESLLADVVDTIDAALADGGADLALVRRALLARHAQERAERQAQAQAQTQQKSEEAAAQDGAGEEDDGDVEADAAAVAEAHSLNRLLPASLQRRLVAVHCPSSERIVAAGGVFQFAVELAPVASAAADGKFDGESVEGDGTTVAPLILAQGHDIAGNDLVRGSAPGLRADLVCVCAVGVYACAVRRGVSFVLRATRTD
jgi:hypothetical protein